ncbi:MAG: hypothetical protein FWC16_14475, partial [Defluviitaleaceae bacterium]|nr:hypothetical protein [Defluviitaleaceae bacterium]MCL2276120.1 hypothetical protein [Defluviitaleaceae bacterium]
KLYGIPRHPIIQIPKRQQIQTPQVAWSWLCGKKITSNPIRLTVLPAASNNANLASLSVNPGALNPAFNAAVTSYTVSVANNVSSI